MELLNFSMPPYARFQWASKKLKEEWEPRMNAAIQAYNDLERLTVQHGLRECTTMHIPPNRMVPVMMDLARKGLSFVPIQQVGEYTGFAHSHPAVVPGRPWTWYGAISRNPESAFKFAYFSNQELNHDELGKLLGYPDCCREFFLREWGAGYVDPVWQEANNCQPENIKKRGSNHIRLRATTPWESNVMMRYLGLRIVPHIPCSHDCVHTQAYAQSWLNLGKELQLQGIYDLEELLQHPIEWDCFKGIAYVSTPLFKIETNSMPTTEKFVVQREGNSYPAGAPKGLKFPWNEEWKFHGIDAKGCGPDESEAPRISTDR